MSAGRDTRQEGGFLGRWSERKLQARAEPEAAPDADAGVAGEAARAEDLPAAEPRTEAEILEELGLPDPDTLSKGDDFSGFMARAVPAALRNRALRKLWLTDPVLANLDGLNDYEQDFTDAATVVKGGVKTAYRVGRGLLRDEPEPGAGDAATAEAETVAEPEAAAGEQTERSAADRGQPEDGEPRGAEQASQDGKRHDMQGRQGDGAGEPEPPRDGPAERPDSPSGDGTRETAQGPRRMRFRFDG